MKKALEEGSVRIVAVVALALVFVAGVAVAQVMSGLGVDKRGLPIACIDDGSDKRCYIMISGAQTDDDSTSNCDDLSTFGENYTLPDPGDEYEIRVEGNCASILCGPTDPASSVSTAKGGHWIKVCDGVPYTGRLPSAVCAHVAPSVGGEICYIHKNDALAFP